MHDRKPPPPIDMHAALQGRRRPPPPPPPPPAAAAAAARRRRRRRRRRRLPPPPTSRPLSPVQGPSSDLPASPKQRASSGRSTRPAAMAEGGKKLDPRTVFVRGVDAAVDDAQLQEFFAEVGPVKNAFLVRRGKGAPHRGFGFVQFALAEDAERAAAQLHGAELAGRKLKVGAQGDACRVRLVQGAPCLHAAAALVCFACGWLLLPDDQPHPAAAAARRWRAR